MKKRQVVLDNKIIGDRIRQQRYKKKLTGKQLADLCSISEQAIRMYEHGYRRPLDSIKVAICNNLGTSVQKIFFSE